MTPPHHGHPRAWMSWSSGKDSAFALHQIDQDPELEVVGLLTTINAAAERVTMQTTHRETPALAKRCVNKRFG